MNQLSYKSGSREVALAATRLFLRAMIYARCYWRVTDGRWLRSNITRYLDNSILVLRDAATIIKDKKGDEVDWKSPGATNM